MPEIQLLGDSQFCRYKNFLLASNHSNINLTLSTVYAISGSTIAALKHKIKTTRPNLDPLIPVLLFIGTNDLTKGTQYEGFVNNYLSLLRLLKRLYGFHKLIMMKIPAYPLFSNKQQTLLLIHKINKFLSTLQRDELSILHLPSINRGNLFYFEQFYGKSHRRDLVHLNNLGFQYISTTLMHEL